MAKQLFTVQEANALVPRVALRMQQMQQAALRLQDEAQAYAEETGRDLAEVTPRELASARPGVRELINTLDAAMEDLQSTGVEVKDLHLGLCDFPSQQHGEIVYLCWQTGEPEIAFWHATDEGFAGRQPLPGASRTPSVQ